MDLSIGPQAYVTLWLKDFFFERTAHAHEHLKSLLAIVQEAAYYSKNYSRIFSPDLALLLFSDFLDYFLTCMKLNHILACSNDEDCNYIYII